MGWKSPPSSLCPVCSRSAFPAESYMAADRTPYHKACLKCQHCTKRLTPATLAEHQKTLYCNACYQDIFITMVAFIQFGNLKITYVTIRMPVGGPHSPSTEEFF